MLVVRACVHLNDANVHSSDCDLEWIGLAATLLNTKCCQYRSTISISEKFLTMPEFTCGLEKEIKIYGIGEFGVDSYLIFCAGEGRNITPNDKNLRAFTTWLKSVPDDLAPQPGQEDGTGERVPGPPVIKSEPL